MPKSIIKISFNKEGKREREKEMWDAEGAGKEGKGTGGREGGRDQTENIPTCGSSDVPVVIHSWFLCGGDPQVIKKLSTTYTSFRSFTKQKRTKCMSSV